MQESKINEGFPNQPNASFGGKCIMTHIPTSLPPQRSGRQLFWHTVIMTTESHSPMRAHNGHSEWSSEHRDASAPAASTLTSAPLTTPSATVAILPSLTKVRSTAMAKDARRMRDIGALRASGDVTREIVIAQSTKQ